MFLYSVPYLLAPSPYFEFCLSTICQEGHKYLLLSKYSNTNTSVNKQEDWPERSGPQLVPCPPANSSTLWIQTLALISIHDQPITGNGHHSCAI